MLLWMSFVFSARAQTISNLQQLTQLLEFQPRTNREVRLDVVVCAASRPEIGMLIAQDDSGIELLELGNFEKELHPGERVRIQGGFCLLRKREMGIEIAAAPTVDNDGIHM